ncbi:MAG: hypothetical protein LLG13_07015 [Bacteroidales bacterium]|nr:hypothetical protein [Bacteroidales bacterium]
MDNQLLNQTSIVDVLELTEAETRMVTINSEEKKPVPPLPPPPPPERRGVDRPEIKGIPDKPFIPPPPPPPPSKDK